MENEKKNTKIKVIITIIVVIFVGCIFAGFAIYFDSHKQDKGHATIELSTSIDKIYLGGSGEINAILRYSGNGSIEHKDFAYESDRPDLVSFEQKEGKYTGNYSIEPKRNNESFSDVSVVVTVSCVDYPDIEPNSIQLTVTDAKPLSIQFYRNREDTESTKINIYQGYSIAQINEIQQLSLSIPDYRPSNDFDTEWYDQETSALVSINKDTVFYGDSELKLYGRYRLNKPLMLVDELNGSKNSHKFQTQLYFGEPINDEALLTTLREVHDLTDDWTFEGWVPDLNDNTSENSFKTGLAEGKFFSSNSTLYAKWTSEIYFLHASPDAVGAEILGAPTSDSVSVTYRGKIPKLPEMAYKYADDKIKFMGWFSDIDNYNVNSQIQEAQIYSGSAKQKFYDKTAICITFEDGLNNKSSERWTLYGKSFMQQNILLPSLTLRTGWTFEEKWNVEGYGELTENEIREMLYIWAKPVSLSAIWNVKIRYFADIGEIQNVYGSREYQEDTIRYGSSLINEIPYPQGQNNLWYCEGWYIDESRKGEQITMLNTASDEFITLYQNQCVNTDGKYYLPLYAKWVANILLNYNNSNFYIGDLPSHVEITYGQDFVSRLPERREMTAPKGFSHGGGWYFNSNYIATYDVTADNWKNITTSYQYPLQMSSLYYEWIGETDTITLNCYNADQTDVIFTKQITVRIGDPMPELDGSYIPTGNIPAGQFLGYFYNDVPYYSFSNNKLISARNWDKPKTEGEEYKLYAKYGTTYLVTLDASGGDGGTKSIQASNDFPFPAGDFIAPSRTGYTFEGYFDATDASIQYYDSDMNPTVKVWNKGTGTIVAHWIANKYVVKLNSNGGNTVSQTPITVEFNSSYGNGTYRDSSNKDVSLAGTLPIPTKNNVQGDNGYWTYSFEGWYLDGKLISSDTKVETAGNHELTAKWSDGTWVSTGGGGNPCVITGTLITLADGTQVPVEQLTGQEQLLVWNMNTGSFGVAPIFFLAHADANITPEFVQVVTLVFSDGTEISIAGQHGFWNHSLNKYVFVTAQNAKSFIGDWFNKANTDAQGNAISLRVQLTDVYVHTQLTNVWSPITVGPLCYYANGMLVLPGLTEVFVNIFDVDQDTMKYDEKAMRSDIEKYGLFTYEEFANYLPIPELYFNVFGAKYLKIAFGKGIITWDDVFRLVNENKDFIYWDI